MEIFVAHATSKTNLYTKLERNRLKNVASRFPTNKPIYIYKIFNEPSNRVLGIRIGAHFTLPGLGAAMRTAAIAHFFLRKFANNGNIFA